MESFSREPISSCDVSLSKSGTANTNSKRKKKAGNEKKNNNNNNKAVKLSTDPQSVAARERRHRISERFKILQSLVPGGTKMDTVSMLEEAIHYVKFLQTQIWFHQAMISSMAEDTLPPPPPTSPYFLSASLPPQDSVCSSVSNPLVTTSPSLPYHCFQGDENHETMFSTFSLNM
ncbi:hypothetical protein NE237_010165 [Protea cynaroides]|uniref:BHLH domain-containing protein n=1 Tax=Protea cynaroides TaxID=273540 RepID=A0A9Q0KZA3_9MAGN|nr:hypothetical protein NE237_010165 [Protea cynaroides]